MRKRSDYDIEFKGLKDGIHRFNYTIDDEFFKLIDGSLYDDGKVQLVVDLTKSAQMLVFDFAFVGTIDTICDNCLEPMEQPIDFKFRTFVKFGPEFEEVDDADIVIVPHEEHEHNILSTIYDLIVTSQPIRHVHSIDEGGESTCNPDMMDKLSSYLVSENTLGSEEEEEGEIDPRWSELKKLLDNNNN